MQTDAQTSSRPYTLTTQPRLCGENVDSVQTFNRCGRALATTTNTCEQNNPCERDDAGRVTGRICCISTNLAAQTTGNACGRATGEPIFTFAGAGCDP